MLQKVKFHYETKKHTKISRKKGEHLLSAPVSGYVVGYADEFVIIQETNDFKLLGYIILPVDQINKVRYNNWDKYYNKIMIWEGEADKVSLRFDIDLSSWKNIFKSINAYKLNVIVNCELSKTDTFIIGPIIKVKKNIVEINSFDPAGYLDEDVTKVRYEDITSVQFNDRYVDIFSKYLRRKNISSSNTKPSA